MLITFSVKNWKSFRDETKLNLVAGAEKQHKDRLPEIGKNFRVLPTAAIYGGNASGKSNFMTAIAFAHQFVVNGVADGKSTGVKPFILDAESASQPVKFAFEILVNSETDGERCYEYSFEINRTKVLSEKLTWIKAASETVLYERSGEKLQSIDKTIEADAILRGVMDVTRDNQLCLRNIASQNTSKYKCKILLDVYNWFMRVSFVVPESVSFGTLDENMRSAIGNHLFQLDTGISRLDFRPIDTASLPFPKEIVENLRKGLDVNARDGGFLKTDKDTFVLSKKSDNTGDIECKKLISIHQNAKKSKVEFELADESDGTLRVIDLLPFFIYASSRQSRRVYIIDEIDRSLHTLLLRQLLQAYLRSCSKESRSQIIFSTHDVLQMDQETLRRDEMWLTERQDDGTTTLTSLNSFKEVRKDKSIRRSYLNGHFGGIPNIFLSNFQPNSELNGINEDKDIAQ